MKRKVIQQANRAFTITLPIDWVRANGLSGDSEVDVSAAEKSLTIHAHGDIVGAHAKVDFSNLTSRGMQNYLGALYARGVDEIEIISDKDISGLIQKSLSAYMGYALIEQSGKRYVVKDLNSGNYSHLDEVFKRVFQMILVFYDAAVKDVFGKEEENLESLKARDVEVNKFCLYLQRAINKMSYSDVINGRIMFTYSFALEKISDEIERAWLTNIKYKPKKGRDIQALAELSGECLGKAFDLCYQFSPSKIDEIYAIREKVREKSLEMKKHDAATLRFVRHLVKIAEDSADLNHLALMRELSTKEKVL